MTTPWPTIHKFPTRNLLPCGRTLDPQLSHLEPPFGCYSFLSARKRPADKDGITAQGRSVLTNLLSEIVYRVVVFQDRAPVKGNSHLCYASVTISRFLTRVKLNRVFLPRCLCRARSPGCRFTELQVGTVRISFFHSCASPIK